MQMQRKKLSLAVVQALQAGLVLGFAATARAQAPAPEVAAQKSEKIEVTGTRIPPANLEGASPVTVIDAQTIKVDGLRSVESLLNNLPQVMADMGGNVSNGASGTATVNLRGLGPTRTLVLVNGRRLPAGSPRAGSATAASDLNQIPAPLIKRIEVLTGGAGAIYGSDAVSGVVNFIMNDNFEGVQVEFNQSFYNHDQQNPRGVSTIVAGRAATNSAQFAVPGDKSSDGKIYDANVLMGANFANGKGNATLFFNYKKEDALLESERDFSACSLGSDAAGFNCGGSSTSYPGRFFLNGGSGPSRTVANAAGNTRAFNAALDQYNFAPTNFYQRPSERYGFNASAHYDIYENARVYSEFSFHDDHTVSQIAPSGLFGNPFTIRFENPLLTQDWRNDLGLLKAGDTSDIVIARRNVEGGGRQDDIRHSSFRTVLGVKGDFGGGVWNYDAFMQTAKVIYQETFKNEFSIARSGRALDAVVGPNGTVVCRSVIDGSDPNCVPYNLWSLGKITPEQLNYIQTPGFQKGSTEQTIQGATLAADLGTYGWKLPSAKNGIGVAFGIERRVEKLQLDTDTAFTTGDLAGQGGPIIGVVGQYTVKEVFGEIRAPLIEGAPFAHLLSVNGSVRHSDYSINQKTDSYGFGFEWAPVAPVRTRASYQRAARAPNVHELFDAQSLGLYNNTSDPCAGTVPTATRAQCALTGVTASQYGNITDSPAGQYNGLFGGNPKLRPEKSDSYTVGIVVEPMRNMSATLDFFHINLKDQISTLPSPIVLSQCLSGAGAFYCSLITRDAAGTLWLLPQARIISTNINIGNQSTSGIDIGFNYSRKLDGYGSMAVNFVGTYVRKFETEPIPGLGSYDCVGYFGSTCGVPLPEWRHKLRGTWTTPWNVDVALTWRHLNEVKLDNTSSNALLSATSFEVDRSLAARDYFDLSASWDATKSLTLRAGINNLFDKDPPIASGGVTGAPFGNGNTFPMVYDTLGRRVFINALYKF
ncbi:MAG: TonB-dependent receptor [Betaproteobacteria bacterium]